jgi:hypothetical protein
VFTDRPCRCGTRPGDGRTANAANAAEVPKGSRTNPLRERSIFKPQTRISFSGIASMEWNCIARVTCLSLFRFPLRSYGGPYISAEF